MRCYVFCGDKDGNFDPKLYSERNSMIHCVSGQWSCFVHTLYKSHIPSGTALWLCQAKTQLMWVLQNLYGHS